MNNRATIVDLPWAEAIGILLAVILIVGTVAFFGRFAELFTGGGQERATEVAFRSLVAKINNLLMQTESCAALQGGMNFFVGDDFAIIAFDKNADPLNPCKDEGRINRPLRPDCPKDKSCICLYKTRDTFNDKQPVECAVIDANFIQSPIYPDDYPDKSVFGNMAHKLSIKKGSDYEDANGNSLYNLFIFGSCNPGTFSFSAPSFNTKRLYLEKKTSATVTKVFVANYDAGMEKRYEDCTYPILKEKILSEEEFKKSLEQQGRSQQEIEKMMSEYKKQQSAK